jgi:hypothetical protein
MTEQNLDRLARDIRILALPTRIKFGAAAFVVCLFVGVIFGFSILYALGVIFRALGGMH